MSERWTVETVILSAAILDLPERTVWDVVGPNGGQVARCYEPDAGPQIVADHVAAARLADVESENARLKALIAVASPHRVIGHIHNYPCCLATEGMVDPIATTPAAPAGGSAEDVG